MIFKDFVSQCDLVYERCPLDWNRGLMLGNGDMGVVVWVEDGRLIFTLDKMDVWERRHVDITGIKNYNYRMLVKLLEQKKYGRAGKLFEDSLRRRDKPYPTRIPVGRLELKIPGKMKRFRARLKLYVAEAEINIWTGEKERIEINILMAMGQNILLVRISDKNVVAEVTPPKYDEETIRRLEEWGYPKPIEGFDEKNGVKWLLQKIPGSGQYIIAFRERIERRGKTIVLTVVSDRDAGNIKGYAVNLLKKFLRNIGGIVRKHREWWRKYWGKSYIVIPDPRIENLYYIELYKMGCNMSGKLPVPLQGVWTCDSKLPPWSGDYHNDMNVEMSYWPIFVSNHLELGKPLYEHYFRLMPKFREYCRKFYGVDGIMIICAMDDDGNFIPGWYTVNLWPGNSAWIAHLFWLYYKYTLDKDFLREKAYPFLKGCLKQYQAILRREEDGKYHIYWSTSPEWRDNRGEAWGKDTTCDLALVKFLCDALIESVNILGIDEEEVEKWIEIRDNLAPYPYSPKYLDGGLLIMKDTPLTESHRHFSHLFPIYPITQLTIERDREIIENSVRTLIFRGFGEWTGWSYPWASIIASKARMGNMAYTLLKIYSETFITENTFHVNGDYRRRGFSIYSYQPMTLEGGFGFVAAVIEMLLQSHGDIIRIFPAIPDEWKNIYINRLRAQGGYLVTAKMEDGEVMYIRIESETDNICRIENPFKREVRIVELKTGRTSIREGRIIEFETTRNREYLIYPMDKTLTQKDLEPIFPRRPIDQRNLFGLK